MHVYDCAIWQCLSRQEDNAAHSVGEVCNTSLKKHWQLRQEYKVAFFFFWGGGGTNQRISIIFDTSARTCFGCFWQDTPLCFGHTNPHLSGQQAPELSLNKCTLGVREFGFRFASQAMHFIRPLMVRRAKGARASTGRALNLCKSR